jgi:hypothetical protein
MKPVTCYLRIGSDYLDDAVRYPTLGAAKDAYRDCAYQLDRFGQSIEASIHIAPSKAELAECPDFVLTLGPRGGLVCERV